MTAFFTGDSNGDGLLDAEEFLGFMGGKRSMLGDANARLANKCVWESACHECGMLSAYGPRAPGDTTGDGKFVDLPDHLKPGRVRFHVQTKSGGRPPAPEKCEMATWGVDKRREAVTELTRIAKPYREEKTKVSGGGRGKRGWL